MTTSELIRILQAFPPDAPVTVIEPVTGTETLLNVWAIRTFEGRVVLDPEGVANQAKYPHYKDTVSDG